MRMRYLSILLCWLPLSGVLAAVTFPGVPAPPAVNAKSYILMDFQSGAVLAEENADVQAEPASITKIMTTYVVAEALKKGLISMQDMFTVSEKAWKTEGSRMFIEVNKQVSVEDLIHGMIIQSGNDAAVALAEHVSGSEEVFAAVMNQTAARLGMRHSKFSNAEGLPSPDTYSTARDLALLAKALITDFPDIYKLFAIPKYTYNGITQHNRNQLLVRDSTADGVKTGHTASAGYCLVSSAQRDGMRLIAVVMGTESDATRTKISQELLNYGFRFFETKTLYQARARITDARVWKGESENVELGVPADLALTIPRGKSKDLTAAAEVNQPIEAPITEGQALGQVKVSLEGKEIETTPIVALKAVPAGSFVQRISDTILMLFH